MPFLKRKYFGVEGKYQYYLVLYKEMDYFYSVRKMKV